MAVVTNALTTYTAKGNREDLADTIYSISPTETPLMSALERVRASNVAHEWQTDSLAAATTANAQLEGDTISRSASSATARLINYCQISTKDATVTGTQETTNSAGRKSEMAYQMAKRSKELKRDMETILCGNQGYNAGGAATARALRSLESWLVTNTSRGTTGANSTGATAAATDGTQRAFTETLLKTVIAQVYSAGGEPSLLMVGPFNKMAVSGFAGRASQQQVVAKDMILGAASIYSSDFGELKVVPNRFQRDRSAFVLDPDYAAVAFFRPFFQYALAKVGDAETRVISAEYTLQMRNEGAHGVVADLLTT
jgi:hypothetical protein